jgi:flagellar basal-body rod protein FlgG
MAVSALYAAASGMRALDEKLNVTANNLANVNTVGFKRSRTNFEDLLYQARQEPGVTNVQDEPIPHGVMVGLGSRVSGTQLDFQQGSPEQTNRRLDLMIQGEGFFQVQTLAAGTEITAYTRAGNFTINSEGNVVLSNSLGSILEPAIQIPDDADRNSLRVNERGQVLIRDPASGVDTQIGQIEVARFVNPEGLLQQGRNLYLQTEASGDPITGTPGDNGFGQIMAGFVELSNVDPVRELIDLIFTQRAFELNSQSIQSADETLQIVGNLRRF